MTDFDDLSSYLALLEEAGCLSGCFHCLQQQAQSLSAYGGQADTVLAAYLRQDV